MQSTTEEEEQKKEKEEEEEGPVQDEDDEETTTARITAERLTCVRKLRYFRFIPSFRPLHGVTLDPNGFTSSSTSSCWTQTKHKILTQDPGDFIFSSARWLISQDTNKTYTDKA